MGDEVHASLIVEYKGTVISKSVVVKPNGESSATNVNRAIEHVTKRIQIMVQSEQGVS